MGARARNRAKSQKQYKGRGKQLGHRKEIHRAIGPPRVSSPLRRRLVAISVSIALPLAAISRGINPAHHRAAVPSLPFCLLVSTHAFLLPIFWSMHLLTGLGIVGFVFCGLLVAGLRSSKGRVWAQRDHCLIRSSFTGLYSIKFWSEARDSNFQKSIFIYSTVLGIVI